MLKPAIRYKDELTKLFSERIYDPEWFYYTGWFGDYELPNYFEPMNNKQSFACVDKDDNVIGYLSYRIQVETSCVYQFGLYSFKPNNITLIKDTFNTLESLVNKFHRVEWCVVEGNHAKRGYDKFCLKHDGMISKDYDVCVGPDLKTHSSYKYQIINEQIPLPYPKYIESVNKN